MGRTARLVQWSDLLGGPNMGQRRLDLSPRQPGGQRRQWVAKIDHPGQRLAKEVGGVGRIGHWKNSQKSDSDPAILRGSGCACNGRKPSVRAAWQGFAGRTRLNRRQRVSLNSGLDHSHSKRPFKAFPGSAVETIARHFFAAAPTACASLKRPSA